MARGRRIRAFRSIGVCCTTTAVLCCGITSSAGAKVVLDKVTGQRFGIVAPPAASRATTKTRSTRRTTASGIPTCDTTIDPTCATALAYHNGPVQHAERDFLFFWDPNSFSSAPTYITGMQTFLSDLASGDYSTGHTPAGLTGNPLSVVQQYFDTSGPSGAKRFVPLAIQNAGKIMDTDPFPGNNCTDTYTDFYSNPANQPVTLPICLTAAQIQTELGNFITAHHLPTGLGVEYFVLTPQGVGSCDDGTSTSCAIAQYCGFHTVFGNGGPPILWANMPWLTGTSCEFSRSPTGDFVNLHSNFTDTVALVFSHEAAETMTDPVPGVGWINAAGGDEIGDKCAYQFKVGNLRFDATGLPTQTVGVNDFFNSTFGSDNYFLQTEYNNRAGGCTGWDTDAQPKATLSGPSSVTHGTTATFSLINVSAPAGVAYVSWNFGDGKTATSTTTAIHHVYNAAGSHTVTAILTDKHGNEVKRTRAVTVH